MIVYQGFGPITVDIKLIKPIKCTCSRQSCAFTITSTLSLYEQFTRDLKINGRVCPRRVCPRSFASRPNIHFSDMQSLSPGYYQPTCQPPEGVCLLTIPDCTGLRDIRGREENHINYLGCQMQRSYKSWTQNMQSVSIFINPVPSKKNTHFCHLGDERVKIKTVELSIVSYSFFFACLWAKHFAFENDIQPKSLQQFSLEQVFPRNGSTAHVIIFSCWRNAYLPWGLKLGGPSISLREKPWARGWGSGRDVTKLVFREVLVSTRSSSRCSPSCI